MCLMISVQLIGQDSSLVYNQLPQTDKLVRTIDQKSDKIQHELSKKTERSLYRLQREELRLQKKSLRLDSTAAQRIFNGSAQIYSRLNNEIKSKSDNLMKSTGQYYSWIDTTSSLLKFLEARPLAQRTALNAPACKQALLKVKSLQSQLFQTEHIQEFMRNRREYLQQQLTKYDLGNAFKKFNKEVWYYQAQFYEYKEALKDYTKTERKALAILRELPLFKRFLSEHGMLAGLFNIPGDYARNMSGLQTRAQVQSSLQQRLSTMGPNAGQALQQNLSAAMSELTHMRNRISQQERADELPDFKPNMQRVKTFRQRLELGSNLQTEKSSTYFPATVNVGLSAGYKLNDKSLIGLGASYRLGLGNNWNHVALSHEGIGFRTFIDYRLKGWFWLSGEAELNYRMHFHDLIIFKNYSAWQKSALLGLSKKYKLGSKFKGSIQLLYDFLARQQIPGRDPFVFRTGYNF